MSSAWKKNADGITATRDIGDGFTETRLIDHLDPDELANAIPADPINPNIAILEQIAALETEQSKPRRLREAVLGIDNGWMAEINSQIVALRKTLQ